MADVRDKTELVLQVSDLCKSFGSFKAVDHLSFSIPTGMCVGLLGPNGAGKTTTIEMLENILPPTSGEILYRGEPLDADFKQECGIQFQHTALQDFLTVKDHLRLFKSIYRRNADIDELVESCQLSEFYNQDAKQLSGGQRQRLLLAIALINDPEILFLDEPTTGLDPQSRQNFWTLINGIKQKQKTIVLTTHYMEEAYQLCDRLLIIDRGQLISEGNPRQLLQTHFKESVLHLPVDAIPALPDGFNARKSKDSMYWEIATAEVNTCLTSLLDAGISLNQLTVSSPTLDDLFIELTGKRIRS